MLKAKESSVRLYFASHFTTQAKSRVTRETLCLEDFKYDLSSSLPYYITLITHEIVKRLLERKPWQNTWELKDCIPTIIYTFLLVFHHSHLSNYKSLRSSYPKHFPHPIIVLWVVLVQVGSIGMSHCLANAIGRYCGIRTTSEDKTPRSPLITGAWRAQVHWEVWAKKVYLLSLYPNLFISGSIWLGRPQRDFSSSTSFSLR